MHWKLKALVQMGVSMLPEGVGYELYYLMQRKFGGLLEVDPQSRLSAGIETWKRILSVGSNPAGKTFFEVGTGRALNVPLSFWLMGAGRIITVDTNPYLKSELVQQSLNFISANSRAIYNLFGSLLIESRFRELLQFQASQPFSLQGFLDLCCIDYSAPGDAAQSGLDDASVDYHTSFTVLEHIPPSVLRDILLEGNRIVSPGGLFVHRVDYSDHFSHGDRSLSAINFLQYSDRVWRTFAGNKFMYMNRLRHDDYLSLYEAVGHTVVHLETDVSYELTRLLETGAFRIDSRFADKSVVILSTVGSWIVSRSLASDASRTNLV